MHEQSLRIFVTVVEESSFTAAARQLYMTQSGVSRAIESLERDLGVKLLHRERSGMRTTDVGDRLLMRSRVILAELDRARQEAADISNLRAGKVHIGAYPSVCAHFLPGVLQQFVRAYPDIDINLSESSTAEVENWVRQGVVDVGFAVLPISDLHTLQIAVDKRVCALPEDYGEASSAEPLDVRHLAEGDLYAHRNRSPDKVQTTGHQNDIGHGSEWSGLEHSKRVGCSAGAIGNTLTACDTRSRHRRRIGTQVSRIHNAGGKGFRADRRVNRSEGWISQTKRERHANGWEVEHKQRIV